mmetsp:Transcript_5030/g.12631  ORF Transcript_5030/g.12631 Transcript_5030/m.12631 type:complete len:393 (-) Transcript_5030:617-1795(-)
MLTPQRAQIRMHLLYHVVAVEIGRQLLRLYRVADHAACHLRKLGAVAGGPRSLQQLERHVPQVALPLPPRQVLRVFAQPHPHGERAPPLAVAGQARADLSPELDKRRRLPPGNLLALGLAQRLLDGRVLCRHGDDVGPRERKEVRVGERTHGVVGLVVGEHQLCADDLAAHDDAAPAPHNPALNDVHLVCVVIGVYNLLPLRVRLAGKPHRNLHHELRRAARKVRHAAHPGAALHHRHLPPQRGAHQPQQVAPLRHGGVLRPVAEVSLEPVLQVPLNLVLLAKLRQLVHQLVKLRRPLIQVGDDAAHATHHIRKHTGPKDHGQDGEHALGFGARQDVAVADRGHGHQRPVERGYEHVRGVLAQEVRHALPIVVGSATERAIHVREGFTLFGP